MRGDILSLPQYAFIAWCLVKQRDNFAFTLLLLFDVAVLVSLLLFVLHQNHSTQLYRLLSV